MSLGCTMVTLRSETLLYMSKPHYGVITMYTVEEEEEEEEETVAESEEGSKGKRRRGKEEEESVKRRRGRTKFEKAKAK